MKIKTSELTGATLDWAVAEIQGINHRIRNGAVVERNLVPCPEKRVGCAVAHYVGKRFSPSTDWAQGGPIIEREHVGMDFCGWGVWEAWDDRAMPAPRYKGSTPLVAAMRCYVASKLGDAVEVPDELS